MKVGIVGAGTIVPGFLAGAAKIEDMVIEAICATEAESEKMDELAKIKPIARKYFDYDKMLENQDIDVIYCAVPNHLHYSFTLKALEKGKHVIIEKPMTSTIEEAKELARVAEEKGLYLFEAITTQYNPNYEAIKDRIKDLGDIKIVQLNYSQYSRRYDQFKAGVTLPVFDPKKSGGALMDLGIYNIHFIVGLFGEPTRVHYYPNIEKGIDTSGILVLEYPSFKAVAVQAKDCKAPVCINIQGDKGFIHSDSPANVIDSFEAGQNSEKPQSFNFMTVSGSERLYYELAEFTRIYNEKDMESCLKRMTHSLKVMTVADAAIKDAGIIFG